MTAIPHCLPRLAHATQPRHALCDVMGSASGAGHAFEQQAFAPAGPSCCHPPLGSLLHARQILPRMQPQNNWCSRAAAAGIQAGVHRTPSADWTGARAQLYPLWGWAEGQHVESGSSLPCRRTNVGCAKARCPCCRESAWCHQRTLWCSAIGPCQGNVYWRR